MRTEVTLRRFSTDEMKIISADMDKIKFDRVHRVGGGGSMRHRPIVAKFNPYLGKVIVLNHIPNLDKNKGYGINDQLPREHEERKKQLLPDYRKAKLNQQKVKWSMDKLIIDGEVTVAKRDKVTNINSDTTEQAIRLQQDTTHGPVCEEDGSHFQSHVTKIATQDDIIPALHSIYTDSRVARAEHNIYAYRINSNGNHLEHFHDDGERVLLDMLRNSGRENVFLCVTRWTGPRKLGKKRFDIICSQAKDVLNLANI